MKDHKGQPRIFEMYQRIVSTNTSLDPCCVCGTNHNRPLSCVRVFHIDSLATGAPLN